MGRGKCETWHEVREARANVHVERQRRACEACETRPPEDILGDIYAAQASVISLGEGIAAILNAIEKKG